MPLQLYTHFIFTVSPNVRSSIQHWVWKVVKVECLILGLANWKKLHKIWVFFLLLNKPFLSCTTLVCARFMIQVSFGKFWIYWVGVNTKFTIWGVNSKFTIWHCKFCIYTHPVNSKFTTRWYVAYSSGIIGLICLYWVIWGVLSADRGTSNLETFIQYQGSAIEQWEHMECQKVHEELQT